MQYNVGIGKNVERIMGRREYGKGSRVQEFKRAAAGTGRPREIPEGESNVAQQRRMGGL